MIRTDDHDTEQSAAIFLGAMGAVYALVTYIAGAHGFAIGAETGTACILILVLCYLYAKKIIVQEQERDLSIKRGTYPWPAREKT